MNENYEYVMITVTHKRVRGVLRQFYNVNIVPLETDRFRFGLRMSGKTMNRKRAEKYAADVDAYLIDWLDYEKRCPLKKKRKKSGRS